MSRGKLRSSIEVCADCGAADPAWASVNRGLLICDECCSVHRSLGRHISQIKSLKKGMWSPTQLAMVHTIYNSGANSIWEHSLLDPANTKSGRRKPNAKDPVHPTKADFIRAKHQVLAFVYRSGKEDIHHADGDVSKQLHSSVRTGNVETSLRLLSLGADPNFMHPEKRTSPLHVAARAGQIAQVELLSVYGADPGSCDGDGLTPIDHARSSGQLDVADRLVELQYEVTDRLAFYLCGRKPDHQASQHYIIPEMADSLDMSELAKAARAKLQALPNHLFEELGMDIFDEVDRRENDAIWLSTQNQSALVADRCALPFLPVNTEYSSTRNQGRQKLARFNAREFATLLIDFLSDARRRQLGHGDIRDSSIHRREVLMRGSQRSEAASDDEPLYDSVASDDENATAEAAIETHPSDLAHNKLPFQRSSVPITLESFLDVKQQLAISLVQIQQLLQSNHTMRQEIGLLHDMLQRLVIENTSLRNNAQAAPDPVQVQMPNGHESSQRNSNPNPSQRPQSMYEPREQQRMPSPQNYAHVRGSHTLSNNAHSSSGLLREEGLVGTIRGNSGDYDNSRTCLRPAIMATGLLPEQEAVVKKVTRKIQELLISAQEGSHDSFIPCSEKIFNAITELAALFPPDVGDGSASAAIRQLTSSALRLQNECRSLLGPNPDVQFVAQQVIQCAYDVALAAKQLVTVFQNQVR